MLSQLCFLLFSISNCYSNQLTKGVSHQECADQETKIFLEKALNKNLNVLRLCFSISLDTELGSMRRVGANFIFIIILN